jgi:hypothetical protein
MRWQVSTTFRSCSVMICNGIILLLNALAGGTLAYNITECNATFTDQIRNGDFTNVTNRSGNSVNTTADAIGFTYNGCFKNCHGGASINDFPTTVQELTLWFLPYLTLLAQVPFLTEDKMNDTMVAILTLGSPMLALYSLFITLFNWKWIDAFSARRLQQRRNAEGQPDLAKYLPEILGRLQQYPMVIEDSQLLVSLLSLSENGQWWTALRDHLRDRERRLDASGTAQLFLAVTIYLFSVVQALAQLGGTNQYLTF